MASKKTSMFTLTERLTIDAASTDTFATIDLGSYVDVGDRQAIQIHSVDFIFQSTNPGGYLPGAIGGNQAVHVQVTDLNRGALVFTDDRALVASASLYIDSTSGLNNESDMYPDNYGKGADDGRYVVNDQLYITGLATAMVVNESVNVTVRVNASIVSLTAKDFMAIAIQSTAADN
tara:strand:+ start:381 stop:908 length:528 start_codon:yes stop_codon:yes gene_type:complete